jgi:hypothetical protein
VVMTSSMIGIIKNADKVIKIKNIDRDLYLKRFLVLVMVNSLYLSVHLNQVV